MYSQVCVFLCLLVAGCYGFYGYRGNGNGRRRATCSSFTRPCRMQVTMTYFNGTEAGSMETEMCSCNGRGSCPTDWNNQSHVISRSLISHTSNMVLQMMFCGEIQPQRYCRRGERALIVSGSLHIPTRVDEYNCRCNNDSPLQLHKSRFERYMKIHEYVCDYHKQSCLNSARHCMKIQEDSTSYTCKCPSGKHCRTLTNSSGHYNYPIYGYCRR